MQYHLHRGNIPRIGQSAGNFFEGSPETGREAPSSNFLFPWASIFPAQISLSRIPAHFLEWFVGFAEGDGSFLVSRGRLFFILNQKDVRTLRRIRSVLGFGKVSIYRDTGRYIVADFENVGRLVAIFNGNLLLNKSNARFAAWLSGYNELRLGKGFAAVPFRPSPRNLDLNAGRFVDLLGDGWLAGFTAAEGCFGAVYIRSLVYRAGYRFRSRFLLDQKAEPEFILVLRGNFRLGHITTRSPSENGNQRYVVDSFLGCSRVNEYFRKFPQFHFSKRLAYVKWRKYFLVISNRVLMGASKPDRRGSRVLLPGAARLRRLADSINNGQTQVG